MKACTLEQVIAKLLSRSVLEDCGYVTKCLVYKRYLNTGYPYISYLNRPTLGHRLIYSYYVNPIPDDLQVCHRCDVRACINHEHLFLGTMADNHDDKVTKGRQARGLGHGSVKLNESAIIEIRTSDASGISMADKFGVSKSVISEIRNRKAWKHV